MPFKFGKVQGDFDIYACDKLKSLKNFPDYIGGAFEINGCNSLISLEGGPEEVGGSFSCQYNNSLASLKGAPEVLGKYSHFSCAFCPKITSIKELGKKQYHIHALVLRNLGIKTLEGCPQDIRNIVCRDCANLISLKGCPPVLDESLNCSNCPKLTTLEGAPISIGGSLVCCDCENLVDFKGPEEVGYNKSQGFVNCQNCPKLTDLTGLKRVGRHIYVYGCDSLNLSMYDALIKSRTYKRNILQIKKMYTW